MKGLILKDFYNLWKYYKLFGLLIVVLIVAGCALSQAVFFIPYAVLFLSMLPITFLSLDEKCGWSAFCDAMPVSRAQFVSAKYLIALILPAAVVVIAAATILVTGFDKELLLSVLELTCAALLVTSFTLPLCFAFGPDKGRYVGIFLVCAVAVYLGTTGGVSLSTLKFLSYIPYAGLALFPIAWLVSIPLYQWHRKKQG